MSYPIGFPGAGRAPVYVDTRFKPQERDAVGSAANRVITAAPLAPGVPKISPLVVSSRIDPTQHDVPGRRDRPVASSTVHVTRAVLSHPAPQLLPVSVALEAAPVYLPPRATPMLPPSPTLTARPPFRPAGAVGGFGLPPARALDTRLRTGHDKVGTRT